ncbi:MAG: hypothetical protein CSA96_10590 [Bacteroidetes bacterium]|nr:MAG: hypothetical protein CSA96_10590 [Bacteroidota bacterium]
MTRFTYFSVVPYSQALIPAAIMNKQLSTLLLFLFSLAAVAEGPAQDNKPAEAGVLPVLL